MQRAWALVWEKTAYVRTRSLENHAKRKHLSAQGRCSITESISIGKSSLEILQQKLCQFHPAWCNSSQIANLRSKKTNTVWTIANDWNFKVSLQHKNYILHEVFKMKKKNFGRIYQVWFSLTWFVVKEDLEGKQARFRKIRKLTSFCRIENATSNHFQTICSLSKTKLLKKACRSGFRRTCSWKAECGGNWLNVIQKLKQKLVLVHFKAPVTSPKEQLWHFFFYLAIFVLQCHMNLL